MHIFPHNLKLMIYDILINGLFKQKNYIERINDSHYCEQADVFFSYYGSDF